MTFVANDAGHALAQNDKATDTFTVVSADGTAKQVVTVNITGQNDAATFTGDVAKTIGENGSTVAGAVTATDLDHDQSSSLVYYSFPDQKLSQFPSQLKPS